MSKTVNPFSRLNDNSFFVWPQSQAEHVKAWNQADEITDADMVPEWLDDCDDWGSIRYLCNSSWQYVPHDEQSAYFEEIENCPDCIIADGDCGDGCITHFYIRCPQGIDPDYWTFYDAIESLDDLLQSDEYNSSRFGSSSDDWLHDADRMQRCHDAAEHGCDGSTHGEHIEDWRQCLAHQFDGRLTEQTRAAIEKQIDECEQWHIDNGSIDTQLG